MTVTSTTSILGNGPAGPRCKGRDSGKHCWHLASFQHSMTNHRDDVCCFCGETRCVTISKGYAPPKGHGPYYRVSR